MKHRSNYTRNRQPIHGFTLIELLVVISIIALLLSILMPSLQKARELAKQVVCMSNIRQICFAVETYSAGNDGYYVPAAKTHSGTLSQAGPLWYDRLASSKILDLDYDNPSILHCPMDKRKENYCSYGVNRYVCGFEESDKIAAPYNRKWSVKRAMMIERPAEVAMVGDSSTDNPIGHSWSVYGTNIMWFSGSDHFAWIPNSQGVGFNWSRHNKKFEILPDRIVNCRIIMGMADCHAEVFKSDYFLTDNPYTDQVYASPGPPYPKMGTNGSRR